MSGAKDLTITFAIGARGERRLNKMDISGSNFVSAKQIYSQIVEAIAILTRSCVCHCVLSEAVVS